MKRILIGNLLCVSTLYMPSYTGELCYLSLCNFDIPFDPIFIKTIAASFFLVRQIGRFANLIRHHWFMCNLPPTGNHSWLIKARVFMLTDGYLFFIVLVGCILLPGVNEFLNMNRFILQSFNWMYSLAWSNLKDLLT